PCRASPPLRGRSAVIHAGFPHCSVGNWRSPACRSISPLEGEMSGRTEGGVPR
ncbi:MAG: D-alanyl-D-alanine dipeptidase, partial [Mesorhizobium sp.]